ncbi:hypothetical protein D3C73_544720 [compost metagenome]
MAGHSLMAIQLKIASVQRHVRRIDGYGIVYTVSCCKVQLTQIPLMDGYPFRKVIHYYASAGHIRQTGLDFDTFYRSLGPCGQQHWDHAVACT